MVEGNQDKITGTIIYEPDPNDRIRILINYDNMFRSILWFQVKKEGSIYLTPRYKPITSAKYGSKTMNGNTIHMKHDEGTPMSTKKIKGIKISRHPSGIINVKGERSFSRSLRTISEQKLEFVISFGHPKTYGIITKPKNRDCCLNYPINENCPLTAQFYVSPKEKTKLVPIPNANHQLNLMFEYSNLEIPDITCQLILNHGPSGPWPPHTKIIWREEISK